MKKILILFVISILIYSCNSDNDEPYVDENPSVIKIYKNGTTSNGSIYVPVDSDSFYLDNILYTVFDSYIEITRYDKTAEIGAIEPYAYINYSGKTYKTEYIGSSAFNSCKQLKSITIPSTVTTIGGGAFAECSNLETVIFPDSLKFINHFAFNECYHLKSLQFPDGLEHIGEYAFYSCGRATDSIVLPKNIKFIGEFAFYFSMKVKCYAKVPPTLEKHNFWDPFTHLDNFEIHVPKESYDAYSTAPQWKYYAQLDYMIADL